MYDKPKLFVNEYIYSIPCKDNSSQKFLPGRYANNFLWKQYIKLLG